MPAQIIERRPWLQLPLQPVLDVPVCLSVSYQNDCGCRRCHPLESFTGALQFEGQCISFQLLAASWRQTSCKMIMVARLHIQRQIVVHLLRLLGSSGGSPGQHSTQKLC